MSKKDLLILDSCSLHILIQKIPQEFVTNEARQENKIPRGVDALVMLAKHGDIEVKIPEMVLWETARKVASGADLGPKFYENVRGPGLKRSLEDAHQYQAQIREFLQNAIDGKYPGISVVRQDSRDTSEHAQFICRVRETLDEAFSKPRRGHKMTPLDRMIKVDRAFSQLRELQRTNIDQYADMSIRDMVANTPAHAYSHIICLSDDGGLTRDLIRENQDKGVIALSSKSFLQGLVNSRLLELVGINGSLEKGADPSEQIVNINMYKVTDFLGGKPHPLPFTDTSLPPDQPQNFAFMNMIAARADQIRAGAEVEKGRAQRGVGVDAPTAEDDAEMERYRQERLAARMKKFALKPHQRAALGFKNDDNEHSGRG